MAEQPKPKSTESWMLRRPLFIERLWRELPRTDGLQTRLKELQQHRENVDAVVIALSNQNLASDRRRHLLSLLRTYQEGLQGCLQALGVPLRGSGDGPLWHFNLLDPVARHHLASILGVPEEPEFYDVLEIKAQEYLGQEQAFEALAQRIDFRERRALPADAPVPALALTLSGSLIQISAPLSSRGDRRYRYQNIYGNTHPPDGVLVLDRDVRVGHRLRSVELTTSPVRLLRVMGKRVPWQTQTENFDRVVGTLTSLVSHSQGRLAESGWINPQTGLQRQVNLDAAERVLREDNAGVLERFERLRERFNDLDSDEDERRQVEAELLAVCHYLQSAARELGFDARPMDDLRGFVTEGDLSYRVDADSRGKVTLEGCGGRPDVEYSGVGVGRQLVTRLAPLAFVGQNGALLEVTRPVKTLRIR